MSNNTPQILQGIFLSSQQYITTHLFSELFAIQNSTTEIIQKYDNDISILIRENEELKKQKKNLLSTIEQYEKKFREHKSIIQNFENLFQEEKLALRNELEIEKGKNNELINSHIVILKKNLQNIKTPKIVKQEKVILKQKTDIEEGEIVEESKKRKNTSDVEYGSNKRRYGGKVFERLFCTRCNEDGHYSRDVHCISCNKYGHTIKDCFCRNCGYTKGHVYKYCRSKYNRK